MMVRTAALIGALALAGSAQAQTTSCGWEIGKWVCRAQPQVGWSQAQPPGPSIGDSFTQAYEQGRQRRLQREAHAAAAAAQQAKLNQADRDRAIGQFIRDGNCEDARSLALSDGDLDKVEQIGRVCTPAQ